MALVRVIVEVHMVETPLSADASHVAPNESGTRPFLSMAVAESSAFLPLQTAKTAQDSESLSAPGFHNHIRRNHRLEPNGVAVTKQALAGRTNLVNFVFTCCTTVCPVQTSAFTELQNQPEPVLLKPLGDSPRAGKAYAQRMDVDLKGDRFITGSPQNIDRLANASRLFHEGTGRSKREEQSTALCLKDIEGQISARFNSNSSEVARRACDVHVLDQLTRVAPQQAPLQAST